MESTDTARVFDPIQPVIGYWRPDTGYSTFGRATYQAEEPSVIENGVRELQADVLVLTTLRNREHFTQVATVMRDLGYMALQHSATSSRPAVYDQSAWIAPQVPLTLLEGAIFEEVATDTILPQASLTYSKIELPKWGPQGFAIQLLPPDACSFKDGELGDTVRAMLTANASAERSRVMRFQESIAQYPMPVCKEVIILGEFGVRWLGGIGLARKLLPNSAERHLHHESFERANKLNVPTGWGLKGLFIAPQTYDVDAYGYRHPEGPAGAEFSEFTVLGVEKNGMPVGVTAPMRVRVGLRAQNQV